MWCNHFSIEQEGKKEKKSDPVKIHNACKHQKALPLHYVSFFLMPRKAGKAVHNISRNTLNILLNPSGCMFTARLLYSPPNLICFSFYAPFFAMTPQSAMSNAHTHTHKHTCTHITAHMLILSAHSHRCCATNTLVTWEHHLSDGAVVEPRSEWGHRGVNRRDVKYKKANWAAHMLSLCFCVYAWGGQRQTLMNTNLI